MSEKKSTSKLKASLQSHLSHQGETHPTADVPIEQLGKSVPPVRSQSSLLSLDPSTGSSNPVQLLRQMLAEALDAIDQVHVAQELIAGQSLHAVVVPEDSPAFVLSSSTPAGIVESVKAYLRPGTQLFVFSGSRCPITKPPHPYLITSEGKHPLFEVEELVDSDDGYLFGKESPDPAVIQSEDEEDVVEQLGDPD